MRPTLTTARRTAECPHCGDSTGGPKAEVDAWILAHHDTCPVRHHPTQLVGVIHDDGRDWPLYADDNSGWCGAGRHKGCEHNPGGAHEHGSHVPAGDGIPAYTWRCGCYCHAAQPTGRPPVQMSLLDLLCGGA